jgi:hypothetical protein
MIAPKSDVAVPDIAARKRMASPQKEQVLGVSRCIHLNTLAIHQDSQFPTRLTPTMSSHDADLLACNSEFVDLTVSCTPILSLRETNASCHAPRMLNENLSEG